MRIIQILPKMEVGGVERGVLDLSTFFKKYRTDNSDVIENIIISSGGRLLKELDKEEIKHYELPVHKKSLFSILVIPKLKKILKNENINIVHARSRVPGWISFFATRGTKTHYITTIHGIYKSPKSSQVMGWGKFVICPSRAVARHMKENFLVPEEKIIIINRWVNLEKFRFCGLEARKDSNVIVSAGRITPSKGYEYLIEGFKKIVRQNPYLKLKIVGAPEPTKMDYFDHLRTLVNRFSLNHNVQFTGFRSDVENVLAEARMTIIPSVIDEAFPRAVLEACASGTPVIATAVGGVSEIIENNISGILIEPKNSDQIAQAMIRLLNEPSLCENMAKNAREKVEKLYSMEKSLVETKEIYKKAADFTRILAIKISSLGDIILAIPSLKTLKENFPYGTLSVLTLKKYAPILYGCPYVDEIITLEDDYKKLKNVFALAKKLRMKAFDYIIDFQNNRVSHLISFLSFPRYSFGYSLRLGFLLTKKLKLDRDLDPLSSQEKILELLGLRIKEKKLAFWEIKTDIQENKILPTERKLIGINISASNKWQTKNWPLNNILTFIELINKNLSSYRVVLVGDAAAKEIADKIESYITPKPYNLCGKTSLQDLPAIIKKLKAFVTPDTATLHLAEALNVPTIALFGPTDPRRHTVKGDNLYVFCKDLLCSFCYKPKCKLGKNIPCMEKITPQEIFLKINEIISKTEWSPTD